MRKEKGVVGLLVMVTFCGCGTSDPVVVEGTNSGSEMPSPADVVGQPSSRTTIDTPSVVKEVGKEWGSLSGTFIYDGEPPQRKNLSITQDMELCGQYEVLDESLVVNQENGGLANAIVFLYQKRAGVSLPIHPSYDATAIAKIPLDNVKCRFDPHVQVLRTSQTLVVGNLDSVGHNTKIDTFNNPPINPMSPAGSTLEYRFTEAELRPVTVSCSIHPWMSAWVFFRNDPYFVVTDKNGCFEIKNLPVGDWQFQVWHERGTISDVTLDGQDCSWKRGRFTATIKSGENDLGEIKVAPQLFE
jgi:hypothetical protein